MTHSVIFRKRAERPKSKYFTTYFINSNTIKNFNYKYAVHLPLISFYGVLLSIDSKIHRQVGGVIKGATKSFTTSSLPVYTSFMSTCLRLDRLKHISETLSQR